MKAIVIMNEQHTLLPGQVSALERMFDTYETLSIPATGWDALKQEEVAEEILARMRTEAEIPVFLSPVPLLLAHVSWGAGRLGLFPARVFHNDRREKVELPDGRQIMKPAEDGWQIL